LISSKNRLVNQQLDVVAVAVVVWSPQCLTPTGRWTLGIWPITYFRPAIPEVFPVNIPKYASALIIIQVKAFVMKNEEN